MLICRRSGTHLSIRSDATAQFHSGGIHLRSSTIKLGRRYLSKEDSMKRFERLTDRVTLRSGIIIVAATMVLTLSTTALR